MVLRCACSLPLIASEGPYKMTLMQLELRCIIGRLSFRARVFIRPVIRRKLGSHGAVGRKSDVKNGTLIPTRAEEVGAYEQILCMVPKRIQREI